MLEGCGIHTLIWDAADERLGEWLVASPADATGRGIELHVRQGGTAADLTGANVYFIWKHKKTGVRGCEPFEEIDESLGQFMVYYPAAMCEEEGVVDAQCMVSWDDKSISTRAFTIHVEPVIIGGTESEDGFTLFVETIKRYEDVIEISTEAADAANEAAEAAEDAADSASAVAEAIQAAAQRGDYDGADGEDGFSPTATVTQTAEGATITITDKNGTTTANVAKGVKGDKGDTGATGPKGDKGDTGDQGPQGIQGETGPKGDKGDTGATGAQGPKGETGDTGATGVQGPKGDKGDTGATGATGPQGPKGDKGETGAKGDTGAAGADGTDGISCTHSWNGTVLSVTSASGTSSADLVGPQGPTGATGATGPQGPAGADGADGTTFTPQSPLDLSNGVLSVDLSGYLTMSDLPSRLWIGDNLPAPPENGMSGFNPSSFGLDGIGLGDHMLNPLDGVLARVTAVNSATSVSAKGVLDWTTMRGIMTTTQLDLAAGVQGSAYISIKHRMPTDTLLLNTTSGNLMRVRLDATPSSTGGATVYAVGLGNIYNANVSGGGTYTASSPLSIDANNDISIDLSAYAALAGATFTGAVSGIAPTANAHFATKKYVDDAIAALDDLSGVSF